jgi:hypothetical protein
MSIASIAIALASDLYLSAGLASFFDLPSLSSISALSTFLSSFPCGKSPSFSAGILSPVPFSLRYSAADSLVVSFLGSLR